MSEQLVTRATGFAAGAFGALVGASALVRLAGGAPDVAAWLAFAGVTAGLIALVGLARPLHRLGIPGAVAFVFAIVGCALSIGQLYGLTFTEPRSGPLGPLFPLGYGPFLLGLLALDALIIRTGVLPRSAGALLAAGAVLNVAGFAMVEVRLAGVVIFGLGAIWLGLSLAERQALPAPAFAGMNRGSVGQ